MFHVTFIVRNNLGDPESLPLEVTGSSETVVSELRRELRNWKPDHGKKLSRGLIKKATDFLAGAVRRSLEAEHMSVGTLRSIDIKIENKQ